MLKKEYFDRDAADLARHLIGKIIRVKHQQSWLAARIIETEAYYRDEKASHSSLGYTEKRKAMFMPAGTIYMYYSRAGDSLNISCRGEGNAVLIKSALPYFDKTSPESTLLLMQKLNPNRQGQYRSLNQLCNGQTLLCRSLNLKVQAWDQQQFDRERFYIEDVGVTPAQIIITPRLGITQGRDDHLLLRFVDYDLAAYCSRNPLTMRSWKQDQDYRVETWRAGDARR